MTDQQGRFSNEEIIGAVHSNIQQTLISVTEDKLRLNLVEQMQSFNVR